MGVCCIVFDIDGMLFEFFILILKKIKFSEFCFQYFMFSSRYMLFPTFKKEIGVKKTFRGGGGVFRKTLLYHFISRVMLFSTLKKIFYIEKFPFTYWLNGRWFPQIVDIILYSLVLIFDLKHVKCGGGLGGNIFLLRKNNSR